MARALRVLRVILAAATAAVCLLLCWQAVDIYLTGSSPDNFSAPGVRINPVYTRELVGSRLAAIAPVLFAYLALVVAGLVLQAAAGEKPGLNAAAPAEDRLRALYRRITEIPPEAREEQRQRRKTWLSAGAVILGCMVMGGTYLLNAGNFSSLDLEPVVGSMVKHIAPWVVLGLAAAAAASVLSGQSAQRELEILKSVPKKSLEPAAPAEKKGALPVLRIALYAAALVLLALGAANGGLWDVLVKAVNICTECIGLG
ncbi:MAG: hypothetical protein HDT14_04745 [Oscillibacter sp.]|nr:hypothetical protein [Oscillibacter sp.]